MNSNFNLKLGIVPIKRGPGFTSAENALITKNRALSVLHKLNHPVDLITIDEIVSDGIATDPHQVANITAYLKAQKVDAIFVIHTDFGSEEVVAKVGKTMGLPLLLWGERDDAPSAEGVRIRDTQCGIFASSKVLQRFGVPFTYIENCRASDPAFAQGVVDFCRSAAIVKVFKGNGNGMKILKIGDRPSSFLSVMSNEDELLSKFGIEVIPLPISQLVTGVKALTAAPTPELDAHIACIKARMGYDQLGEEKLATLAAMVVFIKKEMESLEAAAASIECWNGLQQFLGFVPCQVIGELTALGYPIACEGDICGAVTAAMAHGADYNRSPSFFADLTIRHPNNDNAELLWHCGPFPHALVKENETPWLDSGGRGQWQLKDGELTILRFDGLNGDYSLFVGGGKTTDGPKSTGTYVWMEVDDWVKWERKLIYGPYIHHVVGVYGDYVDVMKEACKYIPGLVADLVNQ